MRVDMGWNNSKSGAAWQVAHAGRGFIGAGWYRLRFRVPAASGGAGGQPGGLSHRG
jgi:hypothetical protein